MRFIHSEEGSYRIRKEFLLLPVKIKNETRWLEKAMWLQKKDIGGWADDCWIPYIEKKGSFFEIYKGPKLLAVVKIKLFKKQASSLDSLFETTLLFYYVCADVVQNFNDAVFDDDKIFVDFKKYNWKATDKAKLPLYVNMTATKNGRELLESL